MSMNILHAMDARNYTAKLHNQRYEGWSTTIYFENLTQLEKAILEEDVVMCKQLLSLGANPALENSCWHNALYMAAIEKRSMPLCRAILTTCHSIKPSLKTVLLCAKRYGCTIPKDIILNCLAPYVIAHAAEQQLAIAQALLTKKYVHLVNIPPYISGPHIIPQFIEEEDFLYTMVKDSELEELLNPKADKLAQLKKLIIQELYASISSARSKK